MSILIFIEIHFHDRFETISKNVLDKVYINVHRHLDNYDDSCCECTKLPRPNGSWWHLRWLAFRLIYFYLQFIKKNIIIRFIGSRIQSQQYQYTIMILIDIYKYNSRIYIYIHITITGRRMCFEQKRWNTKSISCIILKWTHTNVIVKWNNMHYLVFISQVWNYKMIDKSLYIAEWKNNNRLFALVLSFIFIFLLRVENEERQSILSTSIKRTLSYLIIFKNWL